MSKDKKPNNVIQFPGRKKESEVKSDPTSYSSPTPSTPEAIAIGKPAPPPARKRKLSKKTLAGTVLAVFLATGAVNRYVFETKYNSFDFTSYEARSIEGSNAKRGLASIESYSWTRDAKWEKEVAESLASPQIRAIASTQIGRSATLEERLRWGTLEETKYTIAYKPDTHKIHSILLQGSAVEPSYVLDRKKFLNEYGSLFEEGFSSATLKSVESTNEKTVESYTLFDSENNPAAEARFELDRHKRLISLKVEPVQI